MRVHRLQVQLLSLVVSALACYLKVAAEGDCSAAFKGDNCVEPVNLPCFGKAFEEPLTISQEYLGNILPREKLKKVLDVGEVKVQTEDDAVKFFPPSAIWGREDPHSSPFASCAIVGNSPVLTKGGGEWGEEIDSHELVMRFNNAPTKGFERHVGSKTSVRWQNARYSGFRENPDEALLGWYCKPFRSFDAPASKNSFRYDCSNLEQKWPKVLTLMLRKKIYPLNQDFDNWMVGMFREKHASPSSGLRGLSILLHVCKHVYVYGMGGTSEFRNWYWDKYPGFEGKPAKDKLEKLFPRMGDKEGDVDTWTSIRSNGLDRTPESAALKLLTQRDSRLKSFEAIGSGKDASMLTESRFNEGQDLTGTRAYNYTRTQTPTHPDSDTRTSGPGHSQARSLQAGKKSLVPDLLVEDPAHMHRGLEDKCIAQLQEGNLVTIRQ